MFIRKINDDLSLALTIPQYAEEIFALTDANRVYLRRWLPWVDATTTVTDTRDFVRSELMKFAESQALNLSVFWKGHIAGIVGYRQIDIANGVGEIGYWLGEQYTGKGIMSLAVRDVVGMGFLHYTLDKIEIRCAIENTKSRAIPERLGLTHEGNRRNAERVYDRVYDHAIYGVLRIEWRP